MNTPPRFSALFSRGEETLSDTTYKKILFQRCMRIELGTHAANHSFLIDVGPGPILPPTEQGRCKVKQGVVAFVRDQRIGNFGPVVEHKEKQYAFAYVLYPGAKAACSPIIHDARM